MKNEYITEGQEYNSCRELLQPRDNSPASAGEFYTPAQEYPEAPQEHFSSQKPTRTEKTAKRRKNRHDSVAQQAVAITAGAVAVVVLVTAVVGQPIYSQPLTPEQLEASIAESMSGSDNWWNNENLESTSDPNFESDNTDSEYVLLPLIKLDTFTEVMELWNTYAEHRRIDDSSENLYLNDTIPTYAGIHNNLLDGSWDVWIESLNTHTHTKYNANGSIESRQTSTYDGNGIMTSESYLSYGYSSDGTLVGFSEHINYYGKNGNVAKLEVYHYNGDGSLSYIERAEYDENGNTISHNFSIIDNPNESSQNGESGSSLNHVQVSSLKIDTFEDAMTLWNSYPEHRHVDDYQELLYLDDPVPTNALICHHLSDDTWGVVVESGDTEILYDYDSNGLLTRKDIRIFAYPGSYAITKNITIVYRYSSDRALESHSEYIELYDDNGNVFQSEESHYENGICYLHIEEFYYYEHGNLTHEESFHYNTDGTLWVKATYYYDGEEALTHNEEIFYNPDGSISQIQKHIYDEDGNEILVE